MFHRLSLPVVIALALACTLPARAAGERPAVRVGLVRQDNTPARSGPSDRAPTIALLVQQTQLEVLSHHQGWDRVRLWASVTGWVRRADIVFRRPWLSTSTYRAPQVSYHVRAHGPYPLRSPAVITASAAVQTKPGGSHIADVHAGTRIQVLGWQQDAAGAVWYLVHGGWVEGSAVRFLPPSRSRQVPRQASVVSRVSGKGMWLTLAVAQDDPETIVAAAVRNGISHLYVESAISPLGFHGRSSLGPLLHAAHRLHLAVIAWVYPYLIDIASDVELTRMVARFRSPGGDRFDGVAVDLERNMTPTGIRNYCQLVRRYLGPSTLIVGVVYPPESIPEFPYDEVARSVDVLAPMDYWHQTTGATGLDFGHMTYGYDYAYRYAAGSIRAIRMRVGHVPIAPIGQVFDDFGRLEMGPHAPSAAEVRGFLDASKASGAIGASFYQWMTATDAEWRQIARFRF